MIRYGCVWHSQTDRSKVLLCTFLSLTLSQSNAFQLDLARNPCAVHLSALSAEILSLLRPIHTASRALSLRTAAFRERPSSSLIHPLCWDIESCKYFASEISHARTLRSRFVDTRANVGVCVSLLFLQTLQFSTPRQTRIRCTSAEVDKTSLQGVVHRFRIARTLIGHWFLRSNVQEI